MGAMLSYPSSFRATAALHSTYLAAPTSRLRRPHTLHASERRNAHTGDTPGHRFE
ncbi:hypothetical protein BC567DRAFT_238006 [Phyllosticta citribraziliensis]